VNRTEIVTDFLDEKRREITDRLNELKPLIDEYHRLEAAASALDGVGGSSTRRAAPAAPAAPAASTAAPVRRGPGRPRGSKTKTRKAAAAAPAATTAAAPAKRGGARRKAGRRKGSGTRSAQALSFVSAQPGITIPELAARMGIKQNYLYRVLPSLEQEGKVKKQGRGWHASA
jgi:ribosomal protein S25